MDGAIPADFEHVPGRCACEFRPFRSGDGRIHCSRLAGSIEPLPEAGFRSNWTEKHGEAEVESILPGHSLCFQEHAIALFGPIGQRFRTHVARWGGIDMSHSKVLQAPPA